MIVVEVASALAFALGFQVSELEYQNAVRANWGLDPITQEELDRNQTQAKSQAGESERKHEEQRLRGAGFIPASHLQKEGRTLVRATYSEPRLFLRMPGITLERQSAGLRVTLSSDGRARTGSADVPEATWSELKTLEAAAFEPDPPPPPPPHLTWRRGDPLPPAVVCHGWGATLERIAPKRIDKVWAHGCDPGPQTRARLAYAEALAKVALAAFPECGSAARNNGDPFGELGKCFGKFDPATTDNP